MSQMSFRTLRTAPWTDVRNWGAAFLVLTMLALTLAVSRGYQAEHAHQLIGKSTLMDMNRLVPGARSRVG